MNASCVVGCARTYILRFDGNDWRLLIRCCRRSSPDWKWEDEIGVPCSALTAANCWNAKGQFDFNVGGMQVASQVLQNEFGLQFDPDQLFLMPLVPAGAHIAIGLMVHGQLSTIKNSAARHLSNIVLGGMADWGIDAGDLTHSWMTLEDMLAFLHSSNTGAKVCPVTLDTFRCFVITENSKPISQQRASLVVASSSHSQVVLTAFPKSPCVRTGKLDVNTSRIGQMAIGHQWTPAVAPQNLPYNILRNEIGRLVAKKSWQKKMLEPDVSKSVEWHARVTEGMFRQWCADRGLTALLGDCRYHVEDHCIVFEYFQPRGLADMGLRWVVEQDHWRLHTVFHGTYWECAAGIMHSGSISESTAVSSLGEREWHGVEGVYTSPKLENVIGHYAWPCNVFENNCFYGIAFRLLGNPEQLKKVTQVVFKMDGFLCCGLFC